MRSAACVPLSLLLVTLAAGGCAEREELLGVPYQPQFSSGAPITVPIDFQFDDLNPCSGLIHTVMFTGTAWIHENNGVVVVRSRRTITTSSGFEGRGRDTFVDKGNILKFTLNDMLTHPSGDRIRAQLVVVIDLSTTPPTVRVEKRTVTCVGA